MFKNIKKKVIHDHFLKLKKMNRKERKRKEGGREEKVRKEKRGRKTVFPGVPTWTQAKVTLAKTWCLMGHTHDHIVGEEQHWDLNSEAMAWILLMVVTDITSCNVYTLVVLYLLLSLLLTLHEFRSGLQSYSESQREAAKQFPGWRRPKRHDKMPCVILNWILLP